MFENTKNRGRMLGGLALIVLGALQIITNSVAADWTIWLWFGAFVLGAAAFAWTYTTTGEGWAAIVGYVSGALAVMLLLIVVANPEGPWFPALIMLLVAAPFVYAWSRSRQQWGLLIPAYVMLAIIPILFIGESAGEDTLIPAYVLAAVGLPFLVTYGFTRKWPFLIPAGILLALSAIFLLGAIETAGPLINVVIALALIGGGALLLLRRPEGDDALKPKRDL